MAVQKYAPPKKWLMALGVGAVILAIIVYFLLTIYATPVAPSPAPAPPAGSAEPSATAPEALTSQVSGSPGPSAGPQVIADPVSHVVVDPTTTPYSASVKGRTFYFENQKNRDDFIADPTRYVTGLEWQIRVEIKEKPSPPPSAQPAETPGTEESPGSPQASPGGEQTAPTPTESSSPTQAATPESTAAPAASPTDYYQWPGGPVNNSPGNGGSNR